MGERRLAGTVLGLAERTGFANARVWLDLMVDTVEVSGRLPLACWEWEGRYRGDYPYTTVGNRQMGAHKRSWLLTYPLLPIPQGWEIDHMCVNPRCIRPSHLCPVPKSLNLALRWIRRSNDTEFRRRKREEWQLAYPHDASDAAHYIDIVTRHHQRYAPAIDAVWQFNSGWRRAA